MTPDEANKAARIALANAKWPGESPRVETGVLECLLATAEREAKLRAAVKAYIDYWDHPKGEWHPKDIGQRMRELRDDMRAALESKGGES